MASSSKKRKDSWPKGIFSDIFVCSRQELAPFGSVFSFGGENVENQRLGTIFGIIKIDDHSEDSSYVANLLVSVMKKEYFSKPSRGSEESFEASLRKANLALAELARHGSLGWSGKINFASGALERNNLHLACLGNVSAHLIRADQIIEIGRDLAEEKEEEPHPLKTFSNISSGKLERSDKLIFATRDLADVFSKEELRQNAVHFSRDEFPGFLEMSLRANSEFAGVIVADFSEEPETTHSIAMPTPIEGKKDAPNLSNAPPEKPRETKKLDSFVGIPQEDLIFPASEGLDSAERRFAPWKKFTAYSKNVFSFFSGKAKGVLPKTLPRRKGFGQEYASGDAKRYREDFTERKPSRGFGFKKSLSAATSSAARSAKSFGRGLAGIGRKFQKLDRGKKRNYLAISGGIALIVAVVLAVVLAKKKEPAEISFPEDAAMETQTPLALSDTEARIVENVEEFATLPQEEMRITLLENTLYAVSGKDRSVAKINLETKAIEEEKSDLPAGNFELVSAMPHLKTIFLLTGDRKIVSFTPVNKNFQENAISLPGNLKTRDIRSYLTYLYVLDTANSQIYRFPRSEGGFSEGQNWLRATTDLENAKSIAINDDLYLAESGGITAYLQGRKDEKVNFESPQTPLSIDRLYSEPEMEFVWALDNKNHRVVRYSKEGKIIAQYFNESISGVRDFTVDEKNKAVYLLKNNQVMQFSFE